ncbi:hypothetical protein GCM10027285_27100 [Oleiagrimonas citrea]
MARVAPAWIACAWLLGGCAQLQTFKRNVLGIHKPEVTTTTRPAAARPPVAVRHPESVVPLKTIIMKQLQVGHYAKGRKQLRRYLEVHPDDRYARDLWRQLTVNPNKLLGAHSRMHVVQPGESYGTLAAKYLGSATRFLALARYNHADNPSVLQLGQKVRVPADSPAKVRATMAAAPVENPEPASSNAAAAPDDASGPVDRAEQLQSQSLALLHEGHKKQALDRLGQALDLDPKLKPSGHDASTLRKQLLTSYHQRAIVLYRDQKLDPAIALWNRVLAIDPNYEPAIVYRARARELKSRLKQL